MEEEHLEITLDNVKHELPVEFVLILPRPSAIDWTAIKQEDVKTKRIPRVKLIKFDSKWRGKSKLYQIFFICPHCQLVVSRQINLAGHLKTCSKIHPARFECDFCGIKFKTKSSIRKHMLKHSSERNFRCTKCGSGFTRKGDLLKHSRSKMINKCAVCDIKFSCRPLLVCHRSEFHGNVFKCVKCSYHTTNKICFMSHKKIHDKAFACSTCQKKFATNQRLKLHQMQHKHGIYATVPEETFDCDICDKSFSTPKYLKMHQTQVHGGKEVECAVCGRTCKNQTLLSKHSQIHARVECSICHKMLAKSTMALHMRSHFAESLFECDLCGHKTKWKKYLERHLKARHRNGALICNFGCMGKFTEFDHLVKHQKVHIGSKQWKCMLCNYQAPSRSYLSQHMLTNNHKAKLNQIETNKIIFGCLLRKSKD